MTPTFWELYLPALAILFGLGILAGVVEARVRSAIRRWRVQRELRKIQPHTIGSFGAMPNRAGLPEHDGLTPKPFVQGMTLGPGESAYIEIPLRLSRAQLDGLATARDKAERKIT